MSAGIIPLRLSQLLISQRCRSYLKKYLTELGSRGTAQVPTKLELVATQMNK